MKTSIKLRVFSDRLFEISHGRGGGGVHRGADGEGGVWRPTVGGGNSTVGGNGGGNSALPPWVYASKTVWAESSKST